MSQKDRYINDVLRRIFASEADRRLLESDLEAHFGDGEAAGETEAVIIARLGSPEEVAASFVAGLETRSAGFWIRVFAFATDVAAMMWLTLPLLGGAMLLGAHHGDPPNLLFLAFLVPLAMWAIALGIFYFPVLEHHFGKTLGKHLLGLRVLSESRTRVTLGQAFLRRLSVYFEFLVLDALFVPFTEKKQRAFDMVAKTIVVRENPDVGSGWLISLLIIAIPPMLIAGWAFAVG